MSESGNETGRTGESHYNRRATKSVTRRVPKVVFLDKPNTLIEIEGGEYHNDPRVQRATNTTRVHQMASNFQPAALGLITASLRSDGKLYVIDGLHRTAAGLEANYEGTYATRVFEGLTLEEEASLFLVLNSTRSIAPIEKFKVRVTQGDRVAVNINTILKIHGLHVDWASSEKSDTISAIQTLEKVYRGAGVLTDSEYGELVHNVIGAIKYTQNTSEKRSVYSKTFIEGLGIFFATFGKKIDKERLNYTLGTLTPSQLNTQARTLREAKGGSIGENAAEVIWKTYNHRLRVGKLRELWKEEPMGNLPKPEDDPLYVDPAQFVKEPEKASA